MFYDINLLPKNSKKKSGGSKSLMIITGLGCVLCFGVLGYFLPARERAKLKDTIAVQEEEIMGYAQTEEKYNALTEQLNQTTQKTTVFDTLKNGNLKVTKIMDGIEEEIPKNIAVETMNFQDGLLTIEATSPSYKEISQFIVNARQIENVQDVKFTTASRTEEEDGKKTKVSNKFTIYLKLNVQDAFSTLVAEQSQTGTNTTSTATETSTEEGEEKTDEAK